MPEKINPDYYKNKDIETIDAILSQLSLLEAVGYLRGSALKYQMRFGEKHGTTIDASLTDIGKSNWYQEKLMEYLNDAKKQGIDLKEALPKGCENIEQLFKDKNK
tara:strand:+ start:43 stop:357 length:315 start_codon:yes stop_codon:yes gene_type:complete